MEQYGRICPYQAYMDLQADPVLKPIVLRWGECSIKPHDDYFKELCESIISQQISGKVAQTLVKRLIDYLEGNLAPETLRRLSLDELRHMGISRRKGESLFELAEHCLNGTIPLKSINELSDEEIIKRITVVKGIGEWTVKMFLIFSLNRPRVIPDTDYGIRKAIQNLFRLEELPAPQTVAEYYARWAPHETAASWYLWRSLENN